MSAALVRRLPLGPILARRHRVFGASHAKLSAILHFWALILLGLELHGPGLTPLLTGGRPQVQRWLTRGLGLLWTTLLLNFIHLAYRYLFTLWGQADILLNPEQLSLMHVNQHDPGFGLSPVRQALQHPNPFTPLSGSFLWPHASPQSECSPLEHPSGPASPWSPTSANNSLSSSSWVFQRSPASPKFNSSLGQIHDESDLQMYLKEYEVWERNNGSFSAGHDVSAGGSFWTTANSGLGGSGDANAWQNYSPRLRNLSYQMSSPMPQSEAKKGEAKTAGTKSARHKDSLCALVAMDPLELVVWMENIRMWISQTVLRRLVREIKEANRQLQRIGMTDVTIGETGIEKLRKCSQMTQISQSVPYLASLIAYLELTPHQDYMVQRIGDLAQGGAMSEFDWDAGGRFQGKTWSEKLPTDCELVMHCLVCYFDARLPPVKSVIDGKVFSSLYFYKLPDKLESFKVQHVPCAIIQTQIKPPRYILQTDQGDKVDLNPERNNLFHSLLYFFHYYKTKEHGMLGRVNLGRSGINALWVVKDV